MVVNLEITSSGGFQDIQTQASPTPSAFRLKNIPQMVTYQQGPQKALPCLGTHALEHIRRGSLARRATLCAWIRKSVKKKPQVV